MVPITFAHRGARIDEPENTIPAFRRALEQGASGLETDAWLSSDGEVVLAHDALVRRGLRRQRVASSSAAQLADLGVPRLADVYATLGSDYELSVDVKTPRVAEPLIELAREVGVAHRLWLCAPDVEFLKTLRHFDDVRLVHSERRRAISSPLERHAADLANAGIDVMNMHHTDWSGGLVSLFHRFDVRAFAWDVQEVRHLRTALQIGVDAVYCDRPDRMVAVVSEWTDE
ncbi:MAG: glycerophosphoryl diester phosphodiesterase [Actinomycetota bacterium]|nr:glycerophosphoryl diester phosphodiesterase [Actinomycetota bacterium]